MVGSWQTAGPVNGMYRSLTLWPNGRASYTGGGGTRAGYWYNGDIQLADGTRLRVVRESRGELVVLHPTHGRMVMWRTN